MRRWVLALVAVLGLVGVAAAAKGRASIWIDVYQGEPVEWEEMLDDLAAARVVYVGEVHRIELHHEIQARLVRALGERGPVALGIEMMDHVYQEDLDRYARKEIDFRELAERTDWGERWPDYGMYREVLKAARRLGAPIVALNAPVERVREVARKGLDGLDAEARGLLPGEIDVDQPMYEQQIRSILGAHASAMGGESMVEKMFAAQVVRDETMAESLARFLNGDAGSERLVVVLAGSGHVAHDLGIPPRVRRRVPGIEDRIVILSDSGDLELTEQERAMAEMAEMTHADLRHLTVPIGDYLHVREPGK